MAITFADQGFPRPEGGLGVGGGLNLLFDKTAWKCKIMGEGVH